MAEVQLVLVNRQHWFTGFVDTGNERALEMLNSPATDYIRMREVCVCRQGVLERQIGRLETALLPKESTAFAILTHRGHESPQKLLQCFVQKSSCEAFFTIAGYEIFGRLYAKSYQDPVQTLRDLQRFFPVADANVSGPRQRTIAAPAVLVNKTFIESFSTMPLAVEGPLEPAAELTTGMPG